jgi:hypothetical protein
LQSFSARRYHRLRRLEPPVGAAIPRSSTPLLKHGT